MGHDSIYSEDLNVSGLKEVELRLKYALAHSASLLVTSASSRVGIDGASFSLQSHIFGNNPQTNSLYKKSKN